MSPRLRSSVTMRLKRRLVARELERLGAARDAGQAGRVVEVEVEELAEDQLVELAVLLEDERVVEARDQQDVLDAERHQVLEALDGLRRPPERGSVMEVLADGRAGLRARGAGARGARWRAAVPRPEAVGDRTDRPP